MRYFYNLKGGEYAGATNEPGPVPEGCGETTEAPIGGRVWNGEEWTDGQPAKQEQAGAGNYAEQVAGWSNRQIGAALIRATGDKRAALLAEKTRRENS